METQKVGWNITFDKNVVDLFDTEKDILSERLDKGISLGAKFYHNSDYMFTAIFDLENGYVHVRETKGNFLPNWIILDIFAQGLAKACNCDVITFNTKRRAVGRIAEKAGYYPTHEPNEYLKRMN